MEKSLEVKARTEVRIIPVRRTKGLDPRDHNFLVLLPRGWGEASTLDKAIENAKVNLPDYEEIQEVEGTVYLITPDTDAKINDWTGQVALDEARLQHDLNSDPKTEWIEEGNGIEVDGDSKLEFLTNIIVTSEPRPKPSEDL